MNVYGSKTLLALPLGIRGNKRVLKQKHCHLQPRI